MGFPALRSTSSSLAGYFFCRSVSIGTLGTLGTPGFYCPTYTEDMNLVNPESCHSK